MRKNFEPAADYAGLLRQYQTLAELHALTCDELAESVAREKDALAALSRERALRYRPSRLGPALHTVWHWITTPYRLMCIIVAGVWFCVTGGWWRKDDKQ
jgi:hypothetical protein